MKRVVYGIGAFFAGLVLFLAGRATGHAFTRTGLFTWLCYGAAFGVYALADWLGIIPSPYEPSMRDMLHRDSDNSDKEDHSA
jgi:hypothetical protein